MKNLTLLLLAMGLCFCWKPLAAQEGTSSSNAILIPTNLCVFTYYADYQNNTTGFVNNNVANASPDVWYKITLTSTATIKVSTCGSDFDTYLSINNSSGTLIVSNDDNGPLCVGSKASLSQSLAAGTYYIIAEGHGVDMGNIALSVNIDGTGGGTAAEGANISNAIDAGIFSTSGSYSNTKSNTDACLGNDYGQPSNDIYYKFTLVGPANVTLSHCGSNFDTYMHLLDAAGNLIASSDDNSGVTCPGVQAFMTVPLTEGIYYLVSEGDALNTGNIVSNISVQSTLQAPAMSYLSPITTSVGSSISLAPLNTGGAAAPTSRNITTFAGNGTNGFADGTGTAASFNFPSGMALSSSGDLYVADRTNNRIRKVTPAGVVTTFAGSGVAGNANGTGVAATFNSPRGIAIDTAGNLYVADWGNNQIRKITSGGVVTTFAGSYSGYVNGVGENARFNAPDAIAIDITSGTLYVADGNNHRVRKITQARVVTTFAGSGTAGFVDGIGESARLNHPDCLVLDGAGYLYVGETANKRIRKITVSGEVSTFAGSGADGTTNGTGTGASFRSITNITTDGSNLYITDMTARNVRKITGDQVVTTYAGSGASGSVNGPALSGSFINPMGLVSDYYGDIYVSDTGDGRIRRIASIPPFSISPALPAGLKLDRNTGIINGSATVVSSATNYTITATNTIGAGTAILNLKIEAAGTILPSSNQNYVLTYVPRQPFTDYNLLASKTTAQVNQTIQYFDGLGRPLQGVQVQGSPLLKDMVQPSVFDSLGREVKQYLPYVSADNNGSYKANAISSQVTFYASPPAGVVSIVTPDVTYSGSRFEDSALERPLEHGFAGNAWKLGSGHAIGSAYNSNAANEVRLWKLVTNGANGAIFYSAGTLNKTTVTDENGNKSVEFKDKTDKIVLKQAEVTTGVYLSTYYVYDDFDNLKYVIPPGLTSTSFLESDADFGRFVYAYRYDGRRRVVEKKIPGKGWEYMVYNKADQLVMSQDAVQRGKAPQEWTVIKYDALGRIAYTGVYSHTGSTADTSHLSTHQIAVTAQSINWENPITTGIGYTANTYPTSLATVLSINYYDDYSFPGGTTYTYTPASKQTRGLLTGTKINVLGTANMLLGINFYNNKGQAERSFNQHYLTSAIVTGNYDMLTSKYLFSGELDTVIRQHYVNNLEVFKTRLRYQYDHVGRKTKTYQMNNSDTEVLLSELVYNELGQLKEKKQHNSLQSTTYAYNSRGWLTNSNAINKFNMQLKYTDGTTPQYNGNIANQLWSVDGGANKTYTYSYDKLNRLLSGISSAGKDEKSITYSTMGNIQTLTRDALAAQVYAYDGNKLTGVTGGISRTYTYDVNGNVLTDGTNSFTYNLLDLPATVTGVNAATYTYDAGGRKLNRVKGAVTTHYIDGIQYTGNTIDFVQTEEGIARKSGASYLYEYNIKDHLGNSRYSFDIFASAVRKIQQDDYYPFGKRIIVTAGIGAENKYLYNGKELQDGLEQYDFHARLYDPVIGRWNVVDPMAEKFDSYTPYNYAVNNPINVIDPNGMESWSLQGEEAQNWFRGFQSQNRGSGNRPFDWFINNETGNVYYFKGVKDISQELLKKYNLGGNKGDYNRLGGDNMFGDKVMYGSNENILNRDYYSPEAPSFFMGINGYAKVENAKVQEAVYTSGGNFGEERIKSTFAEIKQIGDARLTYVKENMVNKKLELKESTYPGAWSSISKARYNINKPVGQSIRVTAQFYENRSPVGSQAGTSATFLNELLKVFKGLF